MSTRGHEPPARPADLTDGAGAEMYTVGPDTTSSGGGDGSWTQPVGSVPARRTVPILLPDTPPTVTKVFVAAIVAVHVLGLAVEPNELFLRAAKINEAILGYGEYYRLFTVMFLHAGIAHLFMNSYALWIIGRDVERFYGHARFITIYVLGGLTASVASLAMTEAPSVGASGAVFAIFAAEMVLLYRNRSLFGDGAQQRLRSLGMLLVLNAAIGFFGQSFIDNWAHIGGFIGGAAVSWLIAPVFSVKPPSVGADHAEVVDTAGRSRLLWVSAAWIAGLAAVVLSLSAAYR